ncbi:MAG: PASTA domain-containing protein [Saprospiraceae bacterium]
MPYYGEPDGEMAIMTASSDSLFLQNRAMSTAVVPSVVGMGLRDAIYILENRGLKVKTEGAGRVVRQSIRQEQRPNDKPFCYHSDNTRQE